VQVAFQGLRNTGRPLGEWSVLIDVHCDRVLVQGVKMHWQAERGSRTLGGADGCVRVLKILRYVIGRFHLGRPIVAEAEGFANIP
jgi:hypothetical protein